MIDWVVNGLGYILNWIYIGLTKVGIENIGLTIIIFSLIMRLILFPITYKQQKNAKIMKCIQPELNKIQKKYKGKRDNDSLVQMQMEQQQVYQKYATSQTGGCLPMLIQMTNVFAKSYPPTRLSYRCPRFCKNTNRLLNLYPTLLLLRSAKHRFLFYLPLLRLCIIFQTISQMFVLFI